MEDFTQSLMVTYCIYLEKDGRRGLMAIEDCVELAGRGLERYVHGSEERLIQAARGDKLNSLDAANVLKKVKKEKRLQDWGEKALHCQYLRQTKEGVIKVFNCMFLSCHVRVSE